MESNLFVWVEIPVSDMDRAIKFYETVFEFELKRVPMGELEMAWFPSAGSSYGATGTLVKNDKFYSPSNQGTVVYFSSPSGDIENELSRVEAAGGKIIQPKKLIAPEQGHMGVFLDSEGNKMGLNSPN